MTFLKDCTQIACIVDEIKDTIQSRSTPCTLSVVRLIVKLNRLAIQTANSRLLVLVKDHEFHHGSEAEEEREEG